MTHQTGLINDFESAVAFLLLTYPVLKKRNEKRSVAKISATTSDENKIPRKQNRTQGVNQGRNLNSYVMKTGVLLRYHKPAAYNFLTHHQKDELREH